MLEKSNIHYKFDDEKKYLSFFEGLTDSFNLIS